jgi:vacuolar-type H+-ATPase subunit E/Vma4
MQRTAEHFGDQELALIYIAKRLAEALRLENVLTEAGLDYLVEPDKYSGGIIFQSERVGAFFYVAPGDEGAAKGTLARNGFRPYKAE